MSAIDKALGAMRPVFRTREFAAAIQGGYPYARVALHRLKKAGRVKMAKRGWWAKYGALPIEAAAAISYPCYVSFHSALHAHGVTTQIPRAAQLAVCRKAKKYKALGEEAREYKLPKATFRGFDSRGGMPLAFPEKAFADCLRLPRACPLAVLLEALPNTDIGKIRAYCSRQMLSRLGKLENASRGQHGD